jgi:hypothetical protein
MGSSTLSCARGGCKYTEVSTIPPLRHDLSKDPKVVKPTCEKEGSSTLSCARAGCKYTEVTTIPPLGHKFALLNAKYVSIIETSKNSKVWVLTYTAETCSACGIKQTFTVNLEGNNANLAGTVDIGNGYSLVYDIKGNGSNIKTFYIIKK